MDFELQASREDASPPSSISSTLLERIKAQRPEAWRRLIDLYGPVTYRWCRLAGVPKDDAADVVQEVFAALTKHIGGFRRDRPSDSFTAWLRSVTNSKVVDFFRTCQGRVAAEGGTDAYQRLCQVPESSVVPLNEKPEELRSLVTRLGLDLVQAEFEQRTWQAFWQVAVEGREVSVVAADLGMTAQAVYKAKSRVLHRLRQELDGLIDE
jgi:RNA polymerase sigma-70 factor (ECF subfamily)